MRWNPIHTVETIVISVVSMLSDPTDESPANIDAAVLMLWLALQSCFLFFRCHFSNEIHVFQEPLSRTEFDDANI